MSELDFTEIPQSARSSRFLEALRTLRRGEVLTVHLSGEENPDDMIAEARKSEGKWDFQKHRLGDNSWLLHARAGR